jgi:outer membrane lipoprotein-sorting protein
MKKFLCIATLLIVAAVCVQQWHVQAKEAELQDILQVKAYYEQMSKEYPNESNSKGVK